MRSLLLISALLITLFGKAQLLDSIALFTQERPRPVLRLDIRGSFVSNQNVRLMGAKIGLEHARRFQYGIGYTFLFTPVEREVVVEGVGPSTVKLRVGYVTPYVDYAFYQRGPWEVRLPVQIGIGAGSTIYRTADGRKEKLASTGLLIYEPAMTVQYRFLKYFGVGAGWGFRLVVQTGDKLGENLSAPIYIFGLRVFFDDIWKDINRVE